MKETHLLLELVFIVALGSFSQWLSWRLRQPSIVLLLILGILAGPVAGLIQPDRLFGDLLLPFVSIAVAIILFEGGLNLKLSELRSAGRLILNLITIGALITWVLSAAAAHYIIGLDWGLAILIGAVLIVTGPTVILPIIRFIKPTSTITAALKWEGIIIDPIGAMLAVLAFEAIFASSPTVAVFGVAKTILVGSVIGLVAAVVLTVMIRRRLIPEFLHSAAALSFVLIAFALSNLLQPESGLLAVTLMGIFLANQRVARIENIAEFKENLQVLLISAVFIVLSARLEIAHVRLISWEILLFVLALIFVIRPVSVFVSSIGIRISLREKLFISLIAPRGIVAAAVASILSIRLEEMGIEGAAYLLPLTFAVIIITVIFSGWVSLPLSRALGVANPNPQGFLILGISDWSIEMARELQKNGVRVLMVDNNFRKVLKARNAGVEALQCNILSSAVFERLDLTGIGRLLALTPNDEINALASLRFAPVFGRDNVYQLTPERLVGKKKTDIAEEIRAHYLWGFGINYRYLNDLFKSGARIVTTVLSEDFDYEAYVEKHKSGFIPLFVVARGQIDVVTAESEVSPAPGSKIISIIEYQKEENDETSPRA